jgi:stage III sporulation protein AG
MKDAENEQREGQTIRDISPSTNGTKIREAFKDLKAAWSAGQNNEKGKANSLLVGLALLGMLLILLSSLWPQKQEQAQTETEIEIGQTGQIGQETLAELYTYQNELEQRLSALISQLDGAGETTVMVTLESGEETIYALDTQSGQTQSQQTHVLLEDGTALAQTVYLPQVQGVAVLCDGGGDIYVAARITEMLSALLDLPTNHICVEKRSG